MSGKKESKFATKHRARQAAEQATAEVAAPAAEVAPEVQASEPVALAPAKPTARKPRTSRKK